MNSIKRLKLTGAAILVFRFNVVAGGPGSLAVAFGSEGWGEKV
jgi:hypothetical protein